MRAATKFRADAEVVMAACTQDDHAAELRAHHDFVLAGAATETSRAKSEIATALAAEELRVDVLTAAGDLIAADGNESAAKALQADGAEDAAEGENAVALYALDALEIAAEGQADRNMELAVVANGGVELICGVARGSRSCTGRS